MTSDGSICAALSSNGSCSMWDVRSGCSIMDTRDKSRVPRASTVQLLSSTSTHTPLLALATLDDALDDACCRVQLWDVRHMRKPCVLGGQLARGQASVLKTDGLSWVAATTLGEVWTGFFSTDSCLLPAGEGVAVKHDSAPHGDAISCLDVVCVTASPPPLPAAAVADVSSCMIMMTGSLDGSAIIWR